MIVSGLLKGHFDNRGHFFERLYDEGPFLRDIFAEDIFTEGHFLKDQKWRTFRQGHFLKDIWDSYHPFRVFIYTMSPTYEQNMSSNGGYQLGRLSREIIV
jgi:hypothetical protein